MKKQQALDLIDALDSKHQSLQSALRMLVYQSPLFEEELASLEETDSRLRPVVRIMRVVNMPMLYDSQIDAPSFALLHQEINELDSFGEPLKPLLTALVQGFEKDL